MIASLGRFTKYIFSLLELFISNNLLSLCPALYFISTTQIKYKGSLGVNPAHWSTSWSRCMGLLISIVYEINFPPVVQV